MYYQAIDKKKQRNENISPQRNDDSSNHIPAINKKSKYMAQQTRQEQKLNFPDRLYQPSPKKDADRDQMDFNR